MKIVNILGGLGNQMFEYAMYLALKEAHPDEEVLLCRRSYKGYHLHNGYELDRIFDIQAPEASLWQLAKVAYPFINYRTWQVMRHWLPQRKSMTIADTNIQYNYHDVIRTDSLFYDGYWQNEGYFKPIREKVLESFSFPEILDENNRRLSAKILSKNAVSCHVRRGDYLKNQIYCVCNSHYYKEAINKMNTLVVPDLYCIFSDDITWCRENLMDIIGNKEVVFVDWNKGQNSFRDMQLMSLCEHNIIANSSFSWWGAWLNDNKNKVVVAPKMWMNKELVSNPLCDSWVKVESL